MGAGLAVRDLEVVYRAPGGGRLPALGPLTLSIAQGSLVCLIGPSGCGKSSLIRALAGLQVPERGEVFLDGGRIGQPSRRIGLMFQDANLMPWRTVSENITLPLELAGMPPEERQAAVEGLLPRLGLGSEFSQAYPGELSGGMAQRVALGRVLIQHPDVLLLDEPFGALDAMTREQLSLDLMQVWANDGQTIVLVTHNIHEAVLLADRIVVLSRRPGQLLADIAIALPRPRRIEDSYNPYFGEIAAQVREVISQA